MEQINLPIYQTRKQNHMEKIITSSNFRTQHCLYALSKIYFKDRKQQQQKLQINLKSYLVGLLFVVIQVL